MVCGCWDVKVVLFHVLLCLFGDTFPRCSKSPLPRQNYRFLPVESFCNLSFFTLHLSFNVKRECFFIALRYEMLLRETIETFTCVDMLELIWSDELPVLSWNIIQICNCMFSAGKEILSTHPRNFVLSHKFQVCIINTLLTDVSLSLVWETLTHVLCLSANN